MKNKKITVYHSELPLEKDEANLFLKIMSSISVFLFTITLTGFLMINTLVDNWDQDIIDGFTIQISPNEEDNAQTDLQVSKVIVFFENMENVEKVRLVSDKQINKLMKPWLGNKVDISALPLPKLIDVKIKKGVNLDFDKIAGELNKISPYTSINSHQIWLNKLIKFIKSIKSLAMGILIIALLSCSFSIFYATKTSLGIHKNIIEILHIMGATDNYIAKQYAHRSFFIGLYSSIIGVISAAIVLKFIIGYAVELKGSILDSVNLDFDAYLSFAIIVMFTALISMLTAFYTVKRTLGKIM